MTTNQNQIELVWPPNGQTLDNPCPELRWRSTLNSPQELFVNGHKWADLAPGQNSYTCFPLPFGRNQWQIRSTEAGQPISSAQFDLIYDDLALAPLPKNAQLLRMNWQVQSSILAGTDGAALSSTANSSTSDWYPTSMPCTVLSALVRNGVYPNPYVHSNIHLIPDTDDAYNTKYALLAYSHIAGQNPWKDPWWFKTDFDVPKSYLHKRIWLNLNEINYRARIWLNGKLIASEKEIVGLDRRFRLEITDHVRANGPNHLAILIHQLDVPGAPDLQRNSPLAHPGRNMGADTTMGQNYSKWDAVGWDWQPALPDRDMGITEDVYLDANDGLEIKHPYITSNVDDNGRATLQLQCELANLSPHDWQGQVELTITDPDGQKLSCQRPLGLAAAQSLDYHLSAKDEAIFTIQSPQLWWPCGMGKPQLYTLEIKLQGAKGTDYHQLRFGIRTLSSFMDPITQSRTFTVNGRKVFIQGGNWVADMLLMSGRSKFFHEMRIARHSRTNYLRVWGPTSAPPEAFYEAADAEGIMIQQDFLNDYWGTDRNQSDACPDFELVKQASTDLIRRYRNHPSLVLWCGGNEGPNPREDLIKNELLPAFDPHGQRYYLSGSDKDGLQGGGPYHNLPPEEYWNNPKIKAFNSEIGPSGIPPWESVNQFIDFPPKEWAPNRYPLDGQWANHDATDRTEDTRKFSNLDNVLRQRFGAPQGTDLAAAHEYISKAQLLNCDTYRAVMESLNATIWTKTSGFALWKYNSSWPSVTWQITDWFLRQHAGTYAMRRSLADLHVQWQGPDHQIAVVNRQNRPLDTIRLQARLLDSNCTLLWQHHDLIKAPAMATTALDWKVPAISSLCYLELHWSIGTSTNPSHNLYWLAPKNQFAALWDLPAPRLDVQFKANSDQLHITNTGSSPALLIRQRLLDAESGAELLPCYWSDNYFSLMPGDAIQTNWECALASRLKRPLVIELADCRYQNVLVQLPVPRTGQ